MTKRSIREMRRSALGILLFAAATGCGGGGPTIYTAPVSGVVTLNGTPLANASISFQPIASGNPGPPSSDMTDEEGNFTLHFADGKEGAVVGKHKVLISTRKMAPSAPNSDSEVEVEKELVPIMYLETPPVFDVPKDGTDAAKFDLVGSGTAGKPASSHPSIRND
jgi:hypothetical protein